MDPVKKILGKDKEYKGHPATGNISRKYLPISPWDDEPDERTY